MKRMKRKTALWTIGILQKQERMTSAVLGKGKGNERDII